MIVTWFILLSGFSFVNTYEKAERLANQLLSSKHDSRDTSYYCHLKIITLRDSIINKPSDDFFSPVYKFNNEISFYENEKLASFIKRIDSVEFKIDSSTGILSESVFSLENYNDAIYFDQNQKLISKQEFDEIANMRCK